MNQVFKCLSDPTRRLIIELLQEKDLSAGEIASKVDITKSTLSFHLKLLKDAGLIEQYRIKNHLYYSLNLSVIQEVVYWGMSLKKESK